MSVNSLIKDIGLENEVGVHSLAFCHSCNFILEGVYFIGMTIKAMLIVGSLGRFTFHVDVELCPGRHEEEKANKSDKSPYIHGKRVMLIAKPRGS